MTRYSLIDNTGRQINQIGADGYSLTGHLSSVECFAEMQSRAFYLRSNGYRVYMKITKP